MPTFKILTAALALTAIGAASVAMANESDAEHTEPTHTQGSHSDTESGGSAQVPGTRDGAEKTNPYDDVGPDGVEDEIDTMRDDEPPINE